MTYVDSLLRQAERWLALYLELPADRYRHDNLRVKYLRGFFRVLSRAAPLSHEFDALLARAGESQDVAPLLQQFDAAAPPREGDPAPSVIVAGASMHSPLLRRAGAVARLFDHLTEIRHSQGVNWANPIAKIQDEAARLLGESVDFDAPVVEATILFINEALISVSSAAKMAELLPSYWPFLPETLGHAAEAVLNYVRHAAESLASLHATVARFRTYVEWFGRHEVRALISKTIAETSTSTSGAAVLRLEAPLHQYLNRFFFQEGFFPLVNFSVGSDEPDTLSLPASPVSGPGGLPVLIEVKQLLSNLVSQDMVRRPARAFLQKGLAQLTKYLHDLKGSGQVEVRDGVLLVFYDSTKPVAGVYPSVIRREGFVVQVVLVYLGTGSASNCDPAVELDLPANPDGA